MTKTKRRKTIKRWIMVQRTDTGRYATLIGNGLGRLHWAALPVAVYGVDGMRVEQLVAEEREDTDGGYDLVLTRGVTESRPGSLC